MADTETARLCVQIVHSHFGPLTAVSLFCSPQKPEPFSNFISSECGVRRAHQRPTNVIANCPIFVFEAADCSCGNTGSGATQSVVAFDFGRGGAGFGVQYRGVFDEVEIWAICLVG